MSIDLEKAGEYFALFKRLQELKYIDPSGMPGLQSHNLIRPHKKSIVISAGAKWDRLYINRAVYIWTPDRRRIDFISGEHPGDLSADTALPWNSSVTGFAKLYTPGEWHVKTPLIGADVEGARVTLVMSDAALGIDAGNLSAADLVGQVVGGQAMDLFSIHGTQQTAYDLVGGYVPLTWAAAVVIPFSNADVSLLPANANRRAFAIFNDSTAGQKLGVGIENPMTVRRGFYMPGPGVGEIFTKNHPAFTLQGLRGFGSAAGGSVVVVEAT